MSTKFSSIQTIMSIPVGYIVPTPPSGEVVLFSKGGNLYQKDSSGAETPLYITGIGSGVPVYIQDSNSTITDDKYLWVQTNIGGNPTDFTLWIEDGL